VKRSMGNSESAKDSGTDIGLATNGWEKRGEVEQRMTPGIAAYGSNRSVFQRLKHNASNRSDFVTQPFGSIAIENFRRCEGYLWRAVIVHSGFSKQTA